MLCGVRRAVCLRCAVCGVRCVGVWGAVRGCAVRGCAVCACACGRGRVCARTRVGAGVGAGVGSCFCLLFFVAFFCFFSTYIFEVFVFFF